MPYVHGPQGNRIHYRRFGDINQPAVLLVHGLGMPGAMWIDEPEILVREGLQVIVPDNRGTGRSDVPTRAWTMGQMAEDQRAVLDHAGVSSAIVVGISMGGMIAQQLALRAPERVRGLVLMATWPGLPHGRLPRPEAIRRLLNLGRLGTGPMDPESALLLIPEAELPNAPRHFARWPKILGAQPTTPRAFLMQFGAVATHSTGGRIERIRVPTQVVTGAEDILVPPSNSEFLAHRIPGAELEVLPGVGHAVPTLDKDVVRRNVARIVERL